METEGFNLKKKKKKKKKNQIMFVHLRNLYNKNDDILMSQCQFEKE